MQKGNTNNEDDDTTLQRAIEDEEAIYRDEYYLGDEIK